MKEYFFSPPKEGAAAAAAAVVIQGEKKYEILQHAYRIAAAAPAVAVLFDFFFP